MERLTMNNGICQMASTEFCLSQKDCYSCPHGRKCFKRLAAYEDTGLEPEKIDSVFINGVIEENRRLKKLAQAEQDGRLVVLPIPVGTDKVAYGLTDPDDGPQRIATIECDYLEKLEIWDNPEHEVVIEVDGWDIGESDIGKTVFLTREEAEAALKKREEGLSELGNLPYDIKRV